MLLSYLISLVFILGYIVDKIIHHKYISLVVTFIVSVTLYVSLYTENHFEIINTINRFNKHILTIIVPDQTNFFFHQKLKKDFLSLFNI